MNYKEAKFLLSAYRSSGQDANDPQMKEALDQVRNDPTLERWFQGELQQDAVIAKGLQSIAVPENLRAQILAGVKITAASAAPVRHNFRPTLPVIWAVAASIALVALSTNLWMHSNHNADTDSVAQISSTQGLSDWQNEAIKVVNNLEEGHEHFDATGPDVSHLETWLAENHGTTAPSIPTGLKQSESLGCKTLQWHGRPISIVCFKRDGGGIVHMIVMDRAGLPDAPPLGTPHYVQDGKWSTASWSEGNRVVMLATKGDESDLRKLL